MATVKLPSGKVAKVPDNLSEEEVGRLLYERLRETPGSEDDAAIIANKFGLKTTGVGAAIGGTGGGLAGAVGGAALGAPLGPIGIAGGALLGGAGLAGLGGAAGEYAEQELYDVEGDPFEAGLTEAAYGAIPGGAGLAAKGLARGAGRSLLDVGTAAISKLPGVKVVRSVPGGSQVVNAVTRGLQQTGSKETAEDFLKANLGTSGRIVHEFFRTPAGAKAAIDAGINPKVALYRSKGDFMLGPYGRSPQYSEISGDFFSQALKSASPALRDEFRKEVNRTVDRLIKMNVISNAQRGSAVAALLRGSQLTPEMLVDSPRSDEYPLGRGPDDGLL